MLVGCHNYLKIVCFAKGGYVTFDQLQQQFGLSKQELKGHLIAISLYFYQWLNTSDPETAMVRDCSQFYEEYYKESDRG